MEILDLKLKEYKKHFGESYVFYFGFTKNSEEVIKDIDECIKNNRKQSNPIYNDDLVY